MPTDKVNLEVTRYITEDGKPTCALNCYSGEMCVFLGLVPGTFGQKEMCYFTREYLFRPDELGYLEPCKECPLWNKEQ